MTTCPRCTLNHGATVHSFTVAPPVPPTLVGDHLGVAQFRAAVNRTPGGGLTVACPADWTVRDATVAALAALNEVEGVTFETIDYVEGVPLCPLG